MGVTIEVADIERARDYLEAHAGGVLDPRWETDGYVLILPLQLMASGCDSFVHDSSRLAGSRRRLIVRGGFS